MRKPAMVRAPLPLEKHPESIVSWLVIGLALLIFACHAGAAIWSSSQAGSLEAPAPAGRDGNDDKAVWSGAFWGEEAPPAPAQPTAHEVEDPVMESAPAPRGRPTLESKESEKLPAPPPGPNRDHP